jgi:nitrite reductase (NADH) small subunit
VPQIRLPKRTFVASVDEFPPGTMRFLPVGKQGVGVYNVKGRFYALANYCPHRGAPLCLGAVDGVVQSGGEPYKLEWERDREFVRCPWHGWEFEIASGQSRALPDHRARSWKVTVDDGSVYLEGV